VKPAGFLLRYSDMRLFRYEGYEVKVAPEALTLKPFKKVWDRDKSKTKDTAIQELSFVYFYCDPRSDYQYIIDDDDRLEAVRDGEGLPKKWKPDAVLMQAIEFYKTFDTASAALLRAAMIAVDKVKKKLVDADLDETDDKGKPVIPLNTYMATLKMVPEVATMLRDAEKTINDESEYGEARGAIEKTLFDDGLDGI
jgi:hypothetical protein